MQSATTTSTALTIPSASFFPTPTEISTSIRWLRDHPVVAAATCAAATAVSMAAYFALSPKPSKTDHVECFDPVVTRHNSKRGESNASDYPTEKDSGDVACAEFQPPQLQVVPEKGVVTHPDDGEPGSPEWGWYVSTTPPDEMYPPYVPK
ncbi:hypothetical protein AC1031_017378 [Aphanomyces cochlioides]|nr:hypothetical protein AC1031_017378 [Aphanomyces cochlioides]